jgi:SulP family sulfate permease
MVSIVHSLVLLLSAFVLAPLIGRVPLAALAGVLMVTAIRMNEWKEIRWMVRHGFKSAILAFAITMLATAALDLTQAIVIGVALSAVMFISRISNIEIAVKDVDAQMLRERGHDLGDVDPDVKVAYITGPMFFAATSAFRRAFAGDLPRHGLILSMRGVPGLDTSGLELIEEVYERMKKQSGQLFLAAVQPAVKEMLDRAGLTHEIGPDNFFWSADQAIVAAHKNYRADRADSEFEN